MKGSRIKKKNTSKEQSQERPDLNRNKRPYQRRGSLEFQQPAMTQPLLQLNHEGPVLHLQNQQLNTPTTLPEPNWHTPYYMYEPQDPAAVSVIPNSPVGRLWYVYL